jgi:Cytochrome P460
MRYSMVIAILVLAALVSVGAHVHGSAATPSIAPALLQGKGAEDDSPQYASDGALIRPKNFETWVFVGASTGLSYEENMNGRGPGEFHNVYIRPESYRTYLQTGKFPGKTILALALYSPSEKVSPSHAGYFEGNFDSLAVAVKDHSHFPEGWAYFNFGSAHDMSERAMPVSKSNCYSCHSKNGADDNVFVQFYPILRPVMNAHKSGSSMDSAR